MSETHCIARRKTCTCKCGVKFDGMRQLVAHVISSNRERS